EDRLVTSPASFGGGEKDYANAGEIEAWKQMLAQAPIAPQAKIDFDRLLRDEQDYFPGLTSTEKKAKLARISYASFLTDVVKVHADVVKVFQAVPHPLFGVGIDAVSAQDAWGFDLPGFEGMKLDPAPGKGMNRDAIPNEEAEKYFFHFPDGNATIARLLVRKLIPDAIAGSSAADMVLAKANYSKLDSSASLVRIRLNSTAVRLKHVGDAAAAKEVEVAYARGGKVYTVKGKNCILACCHPVYLRRAAAKAAGRAGLGAKSSVALYQRCPARLDVISEAEYECGLRPRLLSHTRRSRSGGQHRGL